MVEGWVGRKASLRWKVSYCPYDLPYGQALIFAIFSARRPSLGRSVTTNRNSVITNRKGAHPDATHVVAGFAGGLLPRSLPVVDVVVLYSYTQDAPAGQRRAGG
jgi:hypothetical protein